MTEEVTGPWIFEKPVTETHTFKMDLPLPEDVQLSRFIIGGVNGPWKQEAKLPPLTLDEHLRILEELNYTYSEQEGCWISEGSRCRVWLD